MEAFISVLNINNEAFKIRAEYIQATVKERETSGIFITGTSGSGKITLARKICENKELAYSGLLINILYYFLCRVRITKGKTKK